MSVLIWCLFISILLPLVAKGPVAFAMNKLGGYNNNHPREQQSKLTGFGARALAAHQNAFEAVIMFAPAVLLAIATNNTDESIQMLAMVHIAARIFYNILYVMNIGIVRTLVWAVGIYANFAILWQCMPV